MVCGGLWGLKSLLEGEGIGKPHHWHRTSKPFSPSVCLLILCIREPPTYSICGEGVPISLYLWGGNPYIIVEITYIKHIDYGFVEIVSGSFI